ncbi:hypothetical protein [Thermogutta sp.]|uniref:hypothetical protein n=1 Tax=Thermogutta sp. TaxID=1962930 RepID=UPI003C7EB3D2
MGPEFQMPIALDNSTLSWIVLALAIVFIWFSLIRMQRRSGRQVPPSSREEPRLGDYAGSGHGAGHLPHPSTVTDWEVRMHELARDIEGRITSKLGLLENLVREADRAAARLEAALRATEQLRQTQAAGVLSPDSPHVLQSPDDSQANGPVADAITQVTTPLQDSQSGIESSEEHGASVGESRSREARPAEEIYTLADYGYDPDEIAQRTGLPVGEVQLILSLRKTRESAGQEKSQE